MNEHQRISVEERALICAPPPADADFCQTIHAEAGVDCETFADVELLLVELKRGAGLVLLTEEALVATEVSGLVALLGEQPVWSDLPILLVTGEGSDSPIVRWALDKLSNVMILDRPVPSVSLGSAVRSALKARRRQYELRNRLQDQALLAAVVESSDDAIVSKTLDGIITSWNTGAEQLFEYSAAEAIGRSITLIIPPERHAEEVSLLKRLRRGERLEHFETVRVSKGGRKIYISLTISPIRDSTGKVVGASKVARDITARKESEEVLRQSEERYRGLIDQLREADSRKDRFLATLAHELRNPLAPLRNGLYLLPKVRNKDPEFEQTRRMMENQLHQMVRLLDDLLDISRIARNKILLRKERLELAWVVNDAVETSRPLIDERNHTFSVQLPAEPVYLDADSVRLAQVFSNLLNNAAKYTEPGGRIKLIAELTEPSAAQATAEVAVRVRDSGLGISCQMLPRVFDLFAQSEDHAANSSGGLGIGLSLVKNLVEMHGGRVEAHSEGPDRGSEFIVRLPLAAESAAVVPPVPVPPAVPTVLAKILVVDDNRPAAETMARALTMFGHETRVAYDGFEAIKTANEFQPDVALLDVGLPGMDGHELARRLRAAPNGDRLKLIAVTGWGREEDRQRSMAAGFDAHFVKPVKISAISALCSAFAVEACRV